MSRRVWFFVLVVGVSLAVLTGYKIRATSRLRAQTGTLNQRVP